MVDGLGLIHMNARLYDPTLGRFLQADPVIQAPGDAQSWNAYTYAFNNPYRYTDPTGMIGQSERGWLAAIIAIVYTAVTWDPNGGFSIYGLLGAAGVGFVSGAIATQSWRGGLRGALTGGLAYGVGWGTAEWGDGAQIAARAVSGGIMESLQGGNFGNGFVAAGVTALAMPALRRIDNDIARTAVGAMLGGTISEATGGKFANGAISGAIQGAMMGSGERELDRQSEGGANADLTDKQVKAQAQRVRGSFSKGKELAVKKLGAYCSAQPAACSGSSSADFEAVNFQWEKDLFFQNESASSVGFTGGYVDRTTSPVTVRLYAGGIALQGNGTDATAMAGVLLHEFRHTTPVGTGLSLQYRQGPSLPYLQRPYEIDAFNFSKEVMSYAPGK